jgi:hypothetical protein
MCASLHTTALTALTLIASSVLATAAEARVLTVGSTQAAAKAIAADFEKQTRNQVTFTIRPPFDIDKELAGMMQLPLPDVEICGGEVSFLNLPLASHHSITSSAMVSTPGGIVRPSDLAIL